MAFVREGGRGAARCRERQKDNVEVEMQRLMLDGPGALRWEAVDEPELASSEAALVEPIAVTTCDLDVAVLEGRYPMPGPYAFGHEGVGRVVRVGSDVKLVAVGETVVIPFQISCGRCGPCVRGYTGNCAAYPPLSTYGLGSMGGHEWGGFLAEMILVPHADAMLVAVPEEIDPTAIASCSDNLVDAWRSVGPQLAAEAGVDVLVVGGAGGSNSIGLYAAGIAVALGAGRVVYQDADAERLAVAAALGAECAEGPPPRKVGAFPVTVDASGNEEGRRCALNSTAFEGTCTSVAVYREDPSVPMFAMYSRGCTLHAGRAHARPAIPAVLELVTRGFDPSLVTSAMVPWDRAAEALADPPMKLLITRNRP